MTWVTLISIKIRDDIRSSREVGDQTDVWAIRNIDLLKEVQRLFQDVARFLSSPKGTSFDRKFSAFKWSELIPCVDFEGEVWQNLRKYGQTHRLVVKISHATISALSTKGVSESTDIQKAMTALCRRDIIYT